ncbi:hypothetical protein V5O48_010056 [Marasmius crinis-equi]|uniref:Uncharacterized protein n=1 Tax=Marasmius crinis-equi TaxID=585013 RepID=A0ABR3FA26_9AGAR
MVSPSSSSASMSSSGVARSPKTDAFRPKLPSDPFHALENDRPLIVHHDELARMLSAEQMTQNVVLILGEPSRPDLDSLLGASTLRDSLLLIVTSAPPRHLAALPDSLPSIQILRLLSLTALQDISAHQLLSIFQRAEDIARRWRMRPETFNKRGQLRESQPGGAFTVPEGYGFSPKQNNTDNSLLSNYTRPIAPSPPKSASTKSDSASFRVGLLRSSKETADTGAKPFDALINFVPSSFSDKAILKHIILVTTLSQTFLSSATHPNRLPSSFPRTQSQPSSRSPSPSFRKRTRNSLNIPSFAKRFPSLLTSSDISLPEQNVRQADATAVVTVSSNDRVSRSTRLSRSANSSSLYVPVALTPESKPTRSHIVHVLPSSIPTCTPPLLNSRNRIPSSGSINSAEHRHSQNGDHGKSKLLQSIERFLRSYSYPLSSARGNGSSTSLHSFTPNSLLSSASSISGSENDHSYNFIAHQDYNERPAAYVVSAGTLCHKPTIFTQPSAPVKHNSNSPAAVVEMLLLGLLDCRHSSSSHPIHDGNSTPSSSPLLDFVTAISPKVWIGQPNDVVIKCDAVAVASATRTGVDVQEENHSQVRMMKPQAPRGSTDGLEEQEHGWGHEETDSRRVSVANSTTRREGSSSASGSSTVSSSGDESPSTSTTSSIDAIGSALRKVEVQSQNGRPSLTARMRRMSSGWKLWKSVSVS